MLSPRYQDFNRFGRRQLAQNRSWSQQLREISRVLSQRDPLANGVDTALLEHVSTIDDFDLPQRYPAMALDFYSQGPFRSCRSC